MSNLSSNDLIFYKENDKIMSGGYSIDSFLLQQGKSPMQTLNNLTQIGGEKVSSPFENLAVPAGIFYINQKIPKSEYSQTNKGINHLTLPDDIHDKLFALVEIDKKRKRQTKKQKINKIQKTEKSKTRKI
jgi:hypothetical protein